MVEEKILNKEKSDEELVLATLKDKESYRFLMQRYEEKLLRYIMRLIRVAKEDAEDILQSAFIKAYINLNDFDQRLKFSSWMYRIVHNEAITHLRRLKSRPKTFALEVNEIILEKLRADLDIEKDVDKNYLKKDIKEIIDSIDKKFKDVIVLRYMEDKDYKEISDILKKPMGTVAILLKRAKEKIKESIINKSKHNIL